MPAPKKTPPASQINVEIPEPLRAKMDRYILDRKAAKRRGEDVKDATVTALVVAAVELYLKRQRP